MKNFPTIVIPGHRPNRIGVAGKLVFFLALGILWSLTARGQEPPPVTPYIPATRLEASQYRTGTIVIRAFTRAGAMQGTGGSVEVFSMEVTEARSGRKERGIVVDVERQGGGERSNRAYIDDDEIDPLIRAIDALSKIGANITTQTNFEAKYSTRGGFAIATFNRAEIIDVRISSSSVVTTDAYFKFVDLEKFKGLLLNAKSKLEAAK